MTGVAIAADTSAETALVTSETETVVPEAQTISAGQFGTVSTELYFAVLMLIPGYP
jgi:hypothetical protein